MLIQIPPLRKGVIALLVMTTVLISCGSDPEESVPTNEPANYCATANNIAVGMLAESSSTDGESNAAHLAIDGDRSTRWSSDYNENEWLQVDLQSPAWICGAHIVWETAYASQYRIEASVDGLNWKTLYTQENGDGEVDEFILDTPISAQFVRFTGLQRATEWGYSIWEFAIDGVRAGPPQAKFKLGNPTTVDSPIQFDATASFDPGGSITRYDWNFDDGSRITTVAPIQVHTFNQQGEYEVSLTVTDNEGNQSTIKKAVRVSFDTATGKSIWDAQCANCHSQGDTFLRTELSDLQNYIEQTMPLSNPSNCSGACAAEVAAYITTWNSTPTVDCSNGEEALERALRLLTNTEYQNTIDDLFNLNQLSNITEAFPGSVRVGGYDNNAIAESVGESRLGVYWEAAKNIANEVAQNRLFDVVNCSSHNTSCGNEFISSIGLKIFRRELTNQERTSYLELFLDADSLADGVTRVLKGMLFSPHFLYRAELGEEENGYYVLNQFEVATLLSYTFTGSTPDDQLLQAAINGQLQSRDQLISQLQRLITLPKANNAMAHFARQWLHVASFENINKDQSVFPEFTDSLRDAMLVEVDKFSSSIFLGEAKRYQDLYLSNYVFANQELANHYGLTGGSSDFNRIDTDEQRGGILKLGAVLSSLAKPNDTSPVLRGVFVRNNLLCQNLPLPDATLEINIPDVDPSLSTRERFAMHSDSPVCAGCHQYIDDVGFGFDTYDGVGKLNPNPDDNGAIAGLNDLTGGEYYTFKGVHELSQILAEADRGAQCVVKQFHIFYSGNTKQDACTIQRTTESWKNRSYQFLDLWTEIVTSETFTLRR